MRKPHPSMMCGCGVDGGACEACVQAPERPDPPGSLVTRPIFMGDVFIKAVERVEAKVKKAKMMKALAPLQVGIGVPGGAAVAAAVVEAVLRADTAKHALNVDIRNMFNELCLAVEGGRRDWARAGELPGPLRGSRLQGQLSLFGRDRP